MDVAFHKYVYIGTIIIEIEFIKYISSTELLLSLDKCLSLLTNSGV